MEKPQPSIEEHVKAVGKSEYFTYSKHAETSHVPPSFVDVSAVMIRDFYPTASINDLAQVLVGQRFESDQEAMVAIKYAETIAAVKKIHSDMVYETGDSNVNVEALFIKLGTTVISNRPIREGAIKSRVESYFEDPVNQLKIDHMAEAVKPGEYQ